MIETIKELCAIHGPSGRERAVREWIVAHLPEDVPFETDPLGNLYVHKKGREAPDQTLMICAHMDEVGLIVTGATDEGYLKFDEIGGIDPAVLIGRPVELENGKTGVISVKPLHLSSETERKAIPKMTEMVLDIGAGSKEEAQKAAPPGSFAAYPYDFQTFGDTRIKCKALDDRVGCAMMLSLIRQTLPYDVEFVFTVQEEVGTRGAEAAAHRVQPDLALILETTTAGDICGVTGTRRACVLGEGPVVSYMDRRTVYDIDLYRKAMSLAEQYGIPCQTKTVVAGGNDAGSVQRTGGGARVLAVSVPTRYLHSPVCVMDETDLESTMRLLNILVPLLGEEGASA
ncbi:MAG: M20/M25/M40 family metallo-hydrolase [Clostridia bacterium]|nr:M20/M25/M40 family metallo-hydrolase [Clostridia bacterium]